jgi:multicomponent K+:H+ antiporter subunit D
MIAVFEPGFRWLGQALLQGHGLMLPVLLPMFAGAVLMAGDALSMRLQRSINLLCCGALVLASMALLAAAADGYSVYRLGGWAPPFGIVLVLDRLSALMLLVTAVLSLFAAAYASRGSDGQHGHFHALFQFQLMGLNCAFLTGDLFNLFVCFEILLIASYGLMMHGGGACRSRASIHYVVLNLIGSALFVLAVGMLYGLTGTLNMADMALRVAALPEADQPLVQAALLLLLVVFGLKAAMLPLLFWLPRAYASASAPVAALFAIMTKLGVYAIIRVHMLILGIDADGGLAQAVWNWLWPLALGTMAFGALGVLAARSLRGMAAYLVILSAGTLLVTVALNTPAALAAGLFYLVHSTWMGAAMFLLADLLAEQRGRLADRLEPAATRAAGSLATVFLILAVAIVGLPPLSGFLSKMLILQSAIATPQAAMVWVAILLAALLLLVSFARAGSTLFWNRSGDAATPTAAPERGGLLIVAALVALTLLVSVIAGPLMRYAEATAVQIFDASAYVDAVLGDASGVMP